MAIVVLTQCATKMQAERGATLIPAINATVWEQGVSTRLALFQDFAPDGHHGESRSLRFVGIQKLNGKQSGALADHNIFAFSIKSVSCVLLLVLHGTVLYGIVRMTKMLK
jgi:hypothetical protein